jgi:predicted transcriptional regulator
MEQTRKIVTSLTLAPDLLARLDTVATAADRSRSWVAGEAIRQYIARQAPEAAKTEDAQ